MRCGARRAHRYNIVQAKYAGGEKTRIVPEGLRGRAGSRSCVAAKACTRTCITNGRKNFWRRASSAWGDTKREADSHEVEEMGSENEQLKALVAELTLKNRVLRGGGGRVKLSPTMAATDVQDTLRMALAKTGLDHVLVEHRPLLLS